VNKKLPILHRLFSLEGKAALITGAGGGIGRVLAAALAEAGAAVAIHDLTTGRLEEPRGMVEAVGSRAVLLTADLRDVDACRKLVAEAHAAMGRLDILVNCAVVNRRKPIEMVTQDDFDTILAVNLRSIYFLCQALHPIMRAQGGGKIVNVGSINSSYGLGTVSVYGATKGALVQVTRVMAVEWAKDNIQVNCLSPGFTLTQLTEKSLWGDEHKSQWMLDRVPARRPARPEEMVGVVLLMASPASSYMTGETIVVDGGFLAGGSWEPSSAHTEGEPIVYERQIPDKSYALAYAFEQKYGACSQCVLAALQDTLGGIDDEVFKAAHALAGGAAKTGQGTCGALAGGMMAISTRYGRERADFEAVGSTQASALAKALYDRFVEEFGSPICAGVQAAIFGRSFNLWDPEERQAFEEAGGHEDKCPDVVGKAAMWTAEILLDAASETEHQ
jgi:2-deoxy-D-gluconate 3-dehydrogenase